MGISRVTLNEDSQSTWQKQGLEYLRYEYPLFPEDVVFDIGSYRGEWAEKIFHRYQCKIIAIEPTPYMDFKQCELINAAASDHDGTLNFGGAYYYSSAHEEPTHSYPCFDINPVLEKYPEIALCKINIEGGEYQLLNHIIEGGLHKQVKDFQIQFHQIEGQPYEELYRSIYEGLSRTHQLTWGYPYCWENWKRD